MRIGLVRRGYSASGGAESYLRGFAQAAVAAGHEVILFASPEWTDWSFGEKVEVVGKSPGSFSSALASSNPREKCEILFSLERVSSCDVYRAGDGVHAAWLKRRANISSSLRRLSFQLNPKHRSLIKLEGAVFKGARRIIANSQMVRAEIAEQYGPIIGAKVHVIYNGIDPDRWAIAPIPKKELREKARLSSSQKVAAFVGSGWERKGLPYAIEATRMANCVLLVAGKGDPGKYRASHVKFLGAVANVSEVLHTADVFILPTLYDPFSNASLEALAAGLPVVTTKSNGVAEILNPQRDGTVVADPTNVAELSAALNHWFGAAQLTSAQAELRRNHAATFNTMRNFRETLHIITS